MATVILTGRGSYSLAILGIPEARADCLTMMLSLQRDDGIERVSFRCLIANSLLGPASSADPSTLLPAIAQWLEREFEQVREAALKSVRSEHQLFDVLFEPSAPGPFRPIG
ncbi:MAG: hypothetical protein ACREQB_02245 [Candidatus Binataceae bacterium]